MTWLRWDTDAPHSDVVGHLAESLSVPLPYAFGLYVACCLGFGQHRPDGRVELVTDSTLEQWAYWPGKKGVFATAFRSRCVGPDGTLRGWWRNAALLRKQQADAGKRKPPKNPPKTPEDCPENPRGNVADDGGRRTEDGYDNGTTPTGLPGRLATRLVGEPGRHAVADFLDRLPATQSPEQWQAVLLGCLDGLGLAQGRAATVSELAAACTDYNPPTWGLVHFRAFVDRIVAKRFRLPISTGQPSDKTARAIAAAKAFAEDRS